MSVVNVRLKTREITAAAVFAVLTCVGAWVSIRLPITPVPITLQVFFVLLSGAILAGRLGALSQVMYILLGISGFPVFAGGTSGPGVLVGPTGGYLFGFIAGAYVTGWVGHSFVPTGFRKLTLATLLGLCPIYLIGVLWLWFWLKSTPMNVLIAGILPFLPGDIIKAVISAYVASRKHVIQIIHQNAS